MTPYRKSRQPMPNEKARRNKELYEYYLKHHISFASLGNHFSISKQRANRIVNDFENLVKRY